MREVLFRGKRVDNDECEVIGNIYDNEKIDA